MVSPESIAEKVDCEDAGGLCAGGVVCGKVVVLTDPTVKQSEFEDESGLTTSMVQCWNGQPLSLATASDLEAQINEFLHPDRVFTKEKIVFQGSQWKAAPPLDSSRLAQYRPGE